MIYEFYVHVIFHPRNREIDQGDCLLKQETEENYQWARCQK
jgi:hypothetical protein